MQTETRLLPLTGAFNFRDLGGYPTVDGRVTRWGQLFRSDALHELTEADIAHLRDVGLSHVIDLRTATEVERSGRGRLQSEAVSYVNLSLTDVEGGEAVAAPTQQFQDSLADRYLWYLDIGRNSLIKALTLISDPAEHPLVFHCAAGKDRTGVLAALVLDILGVDPEQIVEDYALTAAAMVQIMERLTSDPVHGSRMSDVPAHMFAVEAPNMARFLELLHERHGGAAAWAVSAGVDSSVIDAMREELLEDPAA